MTKNCFYQNNTFISEQTFIDNIISAREVIRVSPAQHIMLFHNDSYQFTVLLFALILEKKHVYLPPNKQSGTLEKLAQQCQATIGDINIKNIDYIDVSNNTNTNTLHTGLSIKELFLLFTGDITFFTSGSTGQPKAIKKNCQQLLCELNILANTFVEPLNSANYIVSTVSHQHIYGLLFKILLPLKLGITIINKSFEYPEHIATELNKLAKIKPSYQAILISSPAHLKRLVIDNVLSTQTHYYCATFSSGGLLPASVSQQFQQQMLHAPIEVYGSTETGGIAWRCQHQGNNAPWKIFSQLSYQIDESTQQLSVYSPYIEQQPYLTDDKISKIDQQHFMLQGRADRTVKIEEKRVNLEHIEQCLLTHHWVDEVKVFVMLNKNRTIQREILACVVKLTPLANTTLQEDSKRKINTQLKQHLLTEFEAICLPKKWRYIDKFPYNTQGKLVLSDLECLFD